MSILKGIYSRILDTKREWSRTGDVKYIEIKSDQIETSQFLNFAKGGLIPLIGQTAIRIEESLFNNIIMHKNFVVDQRKTYKLSEFTDATNTALLLFSNGELIDPDIIEVVVINRNNAFIKINETGLENLSMFIFKGIYTFKRYSTNTSLNIPFEYEKSFIMFRNGRIHWVDTIPVPEGRMIPINAQNTVTVLLVTKNIESYKLKPMSNPKYNYIEFPLDSNFFELSNIYIYKNGEVGFIHPTEYTPLYDGIKIYDTDERIVVNIKRVDMPTRYRNLLHQYDLYRDYMEEYLNGSLPQYIQDYRPYEPNVTDNTTHDEFKSEMIKASRDFPNLYKGYLESIGSFQITTHALDDNCIVINSNPNHLLMFNDGLNIAPYKVESNNREYKLFFKPEDINASNIIIVDIGKQIEPYYQKATIADNNVTIGPTSKMEDGIMVYSVMDSSGKRLYELIPENEYTFSVDRNIMAIKFDPLHDGKQIYVVMDKYNRVFVQPYGEKSVIELPGWIGFAPRENIHVFLRGRLMSRDDFFIFPSAEYRILKGKTAVVTNIETDIVVGETITALITNQFEIIEYNETLTAGQKIIELKDRQYPFSKKYFMIFINGRFIHPSNITEIDEYRFSIEADSVHNMCIFRRRFHFEFNEDFLNIVDKWSEFLSTLTMEQLEEFVGELSQISDIEGPVHRDVYFEKRHLFELLYHFCLKGRRRLDEMDNMWIVEEIPDILLPDGRIPISTLRPGKPRYKL